jgi:hypothetical protein
MEPGAAGGPTVGLREEAVRRRAEGGGDAAVPIRDVNTADRRAKGWSLAVELGDVRSPDLLHTDQSSALVVRPTGPDPLG